MLCVLFIVGLGTIFFFKTVNNFVIPSKISPDNVIHSSDNVIPSL